VCTAAAVLFVLDAFVETLSLTGICATVAMALGFTRLIEGPGEFRRLWQEWGALDLERSRSLCIEPAGMRGAINGRTWLGENRISGNFSNLETFSSLGGVCAILC